MKNRDAASRAIGIVDRMNHVGAFDLRVLDSVAERARDGERVKVQKIFLGKFVHDGVDTARLVQVLHVMSACGAELRYIRRPRRNFVEKISGEFDTAFVGNRREVQNRIRRASVKMSRGQIFLSSKSMMTLPARLARMSLSPVYAAGIVPLPGRAMPNTSLKQFIVFAVNSPAQEPQLGQACASRSVISSCVILPAANLPAASKA